MMDNKKLSMTKIIKYKISQESLYYFFFYY